MTSTELYAILKPRVTGFSVNILRVLSDLTKNTPVGELPEITMGGEVKFTLPPVRQLKSVSLSPDQIKSSKLTGNPEEFIDFPRDKNIISSLWDYKELYVVEVNDALGTFYIDVHSYAYDHFKELLYPGSLILASGFIQAFTFGSARNDIKQRQEIHLRALSIRSLLDDINNDDLQLVN